MQNLPLERMTPPAAAECANAIKPKAVYIIHYDQSLRVERRQDPAAESRRDHRGVSQGAGAVDRVPRRQLVSAAPIRSVVVARSPFRVESIRVDCHFSYVTARAILDRDRASPSRRSVQETR